MLIGKNTGIEDQKRANPIVTNYIMAALGCKAEEANS